MQTRQSRALVRRSAAPASTRIGFIVKNKIKELHTFEGLGRLKVEEVQTGDICAIVGLEGFEIGDTVADFETPEAEMLKRPQHFGFDEYCLWNFIGKSGNRYFTCV